MTRGRRRERLYAIAFWALVALVLAFVALPVVVITMAAFNDKAILAFPPQQWSWRWFERALAYTDFRKGFQASLIASAWASVIALAIGTMLAIAARRHDFPGKRGLHALLMSPLVIPHFTIGLGLLILSAQLELARGYPIVVACHVMMVLPFVIRSVYVSLANLDDRLEMAAASLGGRPMRVMWTVTLPLLAPGLLGGWLFAAIMSFNEFTASLFVTTQATQTLPVAMYNYVREYADPTLAALSVIYIGVTAVLLVVADRVLGLGKVLNVSSA